jgi:hypothetical protein
MITVIFSDSNETFNSRAFTQFDYNQEIQFQGIDIPGTPQIHFARKGMEAIVKIPEVDPDTGNITTSVPNSVLQYDGDLTVYLYSVNNGTGKTISSILFHVVPRQKPEGYIIPEDEITTLSDEFISNNTPGDTTKDRLSALEDAVRKLTLTGLGVI